MTGEDLTMNIHPILQLYTAAFYLTDGYLTCANQQNQNNAGTHSIKHGQPLPSTSLLQVDCRLPASCETAESQSKQVASKEKRRQIFFLVMLVYQTLAWQQYCTYIHQVARETMKWNACVALFLLDVLSSKLISIMPLKSNVLKAYCIESFCSL